MCAECASSTQGAYNQQSNLKAGQNTDDNGAQTVSGSVNEQGLPNGQNQKDELTKAAPDTNAKTIGNTGWGQS